MIITLLLLQKSDCLQLLDHVGEGVGDDGDHDEEGEDQDQHSWHDRLYVLFLKSLLTSLSKITLLFSKSRFELNITT